jgi:hypothetical protein
LERHSKNITPPFRSGAARKGLFLASRPHLLSKRRWMAR